MSLTRVYRAFAIAVLLAVAAHAQSPAPASAPEHKSVVTQIPGRNALLLGAAWYPEQWPESRWEEDLRLMEAAHIDVVRVAEFAWSTMEPSEGHLDFGWLERAIRLAEKPTSLLDVAGGHGWFSAELCRRHETLRATVVDLAGSARVGREIIAAAGMSDRVEHREGDMFKADLAGPYDGALVFDIIHHLSGEQIVALLGRVRESMKPGGTLAVLDMFRLDSRRQRASAASLGLLFHLTSGADLHSPSELAEYLREAGFSKPRRTKIRRIPDQDLYQAEAS